MKKYILSSLGLIAVISLATPFAIGLRLKSQATSLITSLNDKITPTTGLQLKLSQYHLGYLHSQATLQIVKSTNGQTEILRTKTVTLDQGPILFHDGKVRFGFAGFGLMPFLKENPLISLDNYTKISYRGSLNGEVKIHLLAKASKIFGLTAKTLKLNYQANQLLNNIKFDLTTLGLDINVPNKNAKLNIEKAKVIVIFHKNNANQWLLTNSILIGKNQLSAQEKLPLSLRSDKIELKNLTINMDLLHQLYQLDQQLSQSNQNTERTLINKHAIQFLNTLINPNSEITIKNMQASLPFGKVFLNYQLSWRNLPKQHDFFQLVHNALPQININVPQLTIDDNGEHFKANQISYIVKTPSIWSQQAKINVEQVSLSQQQQQLFHMDGLALSYAMDAVAKPQHSRELFLHFNWQLKNLCLANRCYNNIDGNLSLNHLKFAAEKEYFKLLSDFSDPLFQNHDEHEFTRNLANVYSDFLTKDSDIAFNQKAQLPEGNFALHGKLTWPDLTSSPSAVMALLDAHYQVNLKAPAALIDQFIQHNNAANAANDNGTSAATTAEKIAQMLKRFILLGYLTHQDGYYITNISGIGPIQPMMNGKKIDMEALLSQSSKIESR